MVGSLPLWRLALLAAAAVSLAACGRNEAADDAVNPKIGSHEARLLPAEEILAGANVPTLDPHTLAEAQIEAVIGTGPHCAFHYTSSGDPVLGIAAEPAEGQPAAVVMLDGDLLALQAGAEPGRFEAGEVQLALTLRDGEGVTPAMSPLRDASLVLAIGDDFQVGYRGYYGCGSG